MSETPFDPEINAYLDGELSGEDRAGFEARMAQDPELRDAVDRLRQLEAGLRGVYSADAAAPAAPIGQAASPTAAPVWRSPRFRTAAMVLLLIGVASVYAVQTMLGGRAESAYTDSFVYQSVLGCFEPVTVCDTPEKFLRYTDDVVGEPIAADFGSASGLGLDLLGWAAFGGAYDEAERLRLPRTLLARGPGGEEIVVYFRGPGHKAITDDPGGVLVSTKDFGRVTAYELSMLDRAYVLDVLSLEP